MQHPNHGFRHQVGEDEHSRRGAGAQTGLKESPSQTHWRAFGSTNHGDSERAEGKAATERVRVPTRAKSRTSHLSLLRRWTARFFALDLAQFCRAVPGEVTAAIHASMTGLQKRDGCVRGIATSTRFRRLVAKTNGTPVWARGGRGVFTVPVCPLHQGRRWTVRDTQFEWLPRPIQRPQFWQSTGLGLSITCTRAP